MSTEILSAPHTAGAGLAFRVIDPATGHWFDFADDTFKGSSWTTPYLAASEPVAANLGTGKSLYQASLNLARLHRKGSVRRVVIAAFEGSAPATTVNPLGSPVEMDVQFSERDRGIVRIPARMSVKSLEGYAIQLAAWPERDGRPVDVTLCGKQSFTADAGTDVITSTAHGLSDGNDIFVHSMGTLPAGLSAGTVYYVRDATTNTFKVAASSGGAAINITGAGSGGVHYWDRPTVLFTVREHGSAIAAFTKTLTPQHVKSGRFEGEYPDGASFTVDHPTDVVTSTAHGLSTNAPIVVESGGTLPTGLSENTTYYVRDVTTNTFKVAATAGGAAIDITSAGTGTHIWRPAVAILEADRQYEVDVSMTLGGESVTDSHAELVIG